MIAVVDYGLGNIQAIVNIYKQLGINAIKAEKPNDIKRADKIILPGVGAFDWAMYRLNHSGMRKVLDDLVLNDKRPVLGICVGMQMMARTSEEGKISGLGWIPAKVLKLKTKIYSNEFRLPHMGWNEVKPIRTDTLFSGFGITPFYFLHSYFMQPDDDNVVISTTDYGLTFASGVRSENVYGTQFHPEKGHDWGIKILENFAELG